MNSGGEKSSRNPDRDDALSREPLLVGEGGVAYRVKPAGDPFVALAELMEVVEALCPKWPPHRSNLSEGRFLL